MVAFIPLVGVTIVWLRAMDRSGWMTLFAFIPLVNIIFSVWLCFAMPAWELIPSANWLTRGRVPRVLAIGRNRATGS